MKILYTKTHPTYYTHTSRYPRSTTGPSSPSFSCLSTGASSVGSLVCVFDLFAYSMSRCCFPTRAFSDVAHRADAVRFMRLSVSRPVVGAFWWRFSQRELPRPNVCTSARSSNSQKKIFRIITHVSDLPHHGQSFVFDLSSALVKHSTQARAHPHDAIALGTVSMQMEHSSVACVDGGGGAGSGVDGVGAGGFGEGGSGGFGGGGSRAGMIGGSGDGGVVEGGDGRAIGGGSSGIVGSIDVSGGNGTGGGAGVLSTHSHGCTTRVRSHPTPFVRSFHVDCRLSSIIGVSISTSDSSFSSTSSLGLDGGVGTSTAGRAATSFARFARRRAFFSRFESTRGTNSSIRASIRLSISTRQSADDNF